MFVEVECFAVIRVYFDDDVVKFTVIAVVVFVVVVAVSFAIYAHTHTHTNKYSNTHPTSQIPIQICSKRKERRSREKSSVVKRNQHQQNDRVRSHQQTSLLYTLENSAHT